MPIDQISLKIKDLLYPMDTITVYHKIRYRNKHEVMINMSIKGCPGTAKATRLFMISR